MTARQPSSFINYTGAAFEGWPHTEISHSQHRATAPSAAGIFLSRTLEDKATLLRLIPNGRMVSHKMSRAGVQLAADLSTT
jgi:hypothetical protein